MVAVAAIEFAYAPGMGMTGVRGFGPEAVSLWLVIFGIVIAVWWAWTISASGVPPAFAALHARADGIARPRADGVDVDRVGLPERPRHVSPEDPLESHPKDKWLKLDESWHDLFAISDKTN